MSGTTTTTRRRRRRRRRRREVVVVVVVVVVVMRLVSVLPAPCLNLYQTHSQFLHDNCYLPLSHSFINLNLNELISL